MSDEINLYNFEDDEFATSKFVLSSPRSLEACDMLGVKPSELLYRPLSDHQEELKGSGLTLEEIYHLYNSKEQGRKKKLRQCRDYRDKMIRDQLNGEASHLFEQFDTDSVSADPIQSRGEPPTPKRLPMTRERERSATAPRLVGQYESWRERPPFAHRHLTPSPERDNVDAHPTLYSNSTNPSRVHNRPANHIRSYSNSSALPSIPLPGAEPYLPKPLPRVSGREFEPVSSSELKSENRPQSRSLTDLRYTHETRPWRSDFDYKRTEYSQPERLPVTKQIDENVSRAKDRYTNRYLDSPRDSAYCSSGQTRNRADSLREDIEKWRLDAETSSGSPPPAEPDSDRAPAPLITHSQYDTNKYISTSDRGRKAELDLLDDSWKNRLSEKTRQLLESSARNINLQTSSLPERRNYYHSNTRDHQSAFQSSEVLKQSYAPRPVYTEPEPPLLDSADLARLERREEMRREQIEAEVRGAEANRRLKIKRGDLRIALQEAMTRRQDRNEEPVMNGYRSNYRIPERSYHRRDDFHANGDVYEDDRVSDFSEEDLDNHISPDESPEMRTIEPTRHIHDTVIKPRLRVNDDKRQQVEERVENLKSSLAERRRKLNEKMHKTAVETSLLRQKRSDMERRQSRRDERRTARRNHRPHKSYQPEVAKIHSSSNLRPNLHSEGFDKKVLKAELNNWVHTGQRYRSRSQDPDKIGRNQSHITLR